MAQEIVPFRIEVPQAEIDDLRDRLARTRWSDDLPDVGWDYGMPTAVLREMVEVWRTSYDWRTHEAALNAFPQFTTVIDGQRIHFLHVRSPEPQALPLLLTHGWPGSIIEFEAMIDPLTNPRAHGGDPRDAFHVVVPSLPGFGFSGPTQERGWDVRRIALAWAELMRRLGYDRYGAQGGDWGSAISRELGQIAPDEVVGVHLNYLRINPSGDLADLSEEDAARVAHTERYNAAIPGYVRIQATRPQTLAAGLTDSPVGLLAWIGEKFHEWADPRYPIPLERQLTDVSIYWFTRTAGSAVRIYFESSQNRGAPLPCPVPLGVAVFPYEIVLPVRRLAEQVYTITHWSEFPRGGHFAALEVPELLTEDVRAFFRELR